MEGCEVSDEDWELDPENAHPKARSVLTDEFFWDCTDEDSPFGNDTGADTLDFFREWRQDHPRGNPLRLLRQLLRDWEAADEHWGASDTTEVSRLIQEDRFSFETRDDAIIALAFGQLVLEGRVDAEVKNRALTALRRQGLPSALDRWPSQYQAERQSRLGTMEAILRQDWS